MIIFSDPYYGLLDGLDDPGEQGLTFRGLYRLRCQVVGR